MEIKYLGQMMSLIQCNKCGMPIEIGATQEYTMCPNCKSKISLEYELNNESEEIRMNNLNNNPVGVVKIGTFEWALMRLKEGAKVQRNGWNGKGMFIYLTSSSEVPGVNMKPETANHLFGDRLIDCETTVEINAHIDMKTANGSITVGWNPSQVDMMADDWEQFIG